MWRIKYVEYLHKWVVEYLEDGRTIRMSILSSSKDSAVELMKEYENLMGQVI